MAAVGIAAPAGAQEPRWWKGNLHTHTLWSDGDDYPEMVLDWYKSRGYHFVAISDHNILSHGSKWVHPDQSVDPWPRRALELYLARFGADWVEVELAAGQRAVRLKTFPVYRALFDEPGRFLTLQAEEITDALGSAALHVNATNVVELIPPQGGETVVEVLERNIDAVYAQRERTGVPMIAHLNHPNFRWSISLEDFVAVDNEIFFEIYNGHPGVHNDGGAKAPGMETFWDHALTKRLSSGGRILWGLAVDDAHDYGVTSVEAMNPGRGWIMVRSAALTPAALIGALESGDFYASNGVELASLEVGPERLALRVREEPGVAYSIEFIGTRKAEGAAHLTVGEVLEAVSGPSAAYSLRGDELYVRARVLSTKVKANGYRAGELERAWSQPLLGPRASAVRPVSR